MMFKFDLQCFGSRGASLGKAGKNRVREVVDLTANGGRNNSAFEIGVPYASDRWFDVEKQRWYTKKDGFTTKEIEALNDEFGSYKYVYINNYLNSGGDPNKMADKMKSWAERYPNRITADTSKLKTDVIPMVKNIISNMDSAFKRAGTFKRDKSFKTVRAVGIDSFGISKMSDLKNIVGKRFKSDSYMSTTMDEQWAKHYASQNKNRVMMHLTVEPKVKAIQLDNGKREITLNRGTSYKVDKVSGNDVFVTVYK